MTDLTYYQRNKEVILNRAKDKMKMIKKEEKPSRR